uniref:PPPDE domain-containing protein n=1 Tax=Arcella intermedia TaxID=1963864 RepID=A0A6B2LIA8_9EUKA
MRCAVKLNVYDLLKESWSDYVYYLGFGVHHSGIEIFNQEFSYGAHNDETSGIFAIAPLTAPECRHRMTIDLGETKISIHKFKQLIQELGVQFTGARYHILYQNCNHFSNELSIRLLGREIPGWVNRLARSMHYVQCLIPTKYLDPMPPTPSPPEPEQQRFKAFSGTAHVLGNDTQPLISSEYEYSDRNDINSRRRLLDTAVQKRLQVNST